GSSTSLSSTHTTPRPRPSTLTLHDALPIYALTGAAVHPDARAAFREAGGGREPYAGGRASDEGVLPVRSRFTPNVKRRPESVRRSEEHTSELQSPCKLVCRLLHEKKNRRVE